MSAYFTVLSENANSFGTETLYIPQHAMLTTTACEPAEQSGTTRGIHAESVRSENSGPLKLTQVQCCVCDDDYAEPWAVGEDFEYRTSPDRFIAMRCRSCGLIYLNPRPDVAELSRIYPASYHAFDFSPARFGLIYKVRRWLEARRALS